MPARSPLEVRFWKLVERNHESACWRWLGSFDRSGQPQIGSGVGSGIIRAHRLLWRIHYGHDPVGRDVKHSCGNRNCLNPLHLYLALPNEGTLEERFWRYVQKSDDPAGCWNWIGSTVKGYGTVGVGGRNNGKAAAHRVSWEIRHGIKLESSQNLLHSCDNRACVNPDHLRIGTQQENVRDCMDKGRFKKPPLVRGESHGGSKLKEQDVREIREMYFNQGASQQEIAAIMGVNQTLISSIVRGKSWKHV